MLPCHGPWISTEAKSFVRRTLPFSTAAQPLAPMAKLDARMRPDRVWRRVVSDDAWSGVRFCGSPLRGWPCIRTGLAPARLAPIRSAPLSPTGAAVNGLSCLTPARGPASARKTHSYILDLLSQASATACSGFGGCVVHLAAWRDVRRASRLRWTRRPLLPGLDSASRPRRANRTDEYVVSVTLRQDDTDGVERTGPPTYRLGPGAGSAWRSAPTCSG